MVAVADGEGDRVAVLHTVPLPEREGDRVALGERVADRVAQDEPLALGQCEGVPDGVMGTVARAVTIDALPKGVVVRVTDRVTELDAVLEGDPDVLGERDPLSVADGETVALGERDPDSVADGE